MVLPSFDTKTGEQFPAYYVFNNDHHLPPDKKTCSNEPIPELNAIIYDIKNDQVIYDKYLKKEKVLEIIKKYVLKD